VNESALEMNSVTNPDMTGARRSERIIIPNLGDISCNEK